ncbi:MAG: hypothetical protein L6Q95_09695 [Planctomycetes bacterium]|nr:hypothetical protein [Planctomycetota bacterium]
MTQRGHLARRSRRAAGAIPATTDAAWAPVVASLERAMRAGAVLTIASCFTRL